MKQEVCHVGLIEEESGSGGRGRRGRPRGLLKVTVLEMAGGKVKLGFEVDADIPVHRLEIWERMCAKGELESPRGGP